MFGAILRDAVYTAADQAASKGHFAKANQVLWLVRCVAVRPRPHETDIIGVVHFADNEASAHKLAVNANNSY